MERKYTYKNGTVYIVGLNENSIKNIQEKTKDFLKKVVKERHNIGHSNKSKCIRAK